MKSLSLKSDHKGGGTLLNVLCMTYKIEQAFDFFFLHNVLKCFRLLLDIDHFEFPLISFYLFISFLVCPAKRGLFL